jgi:hypothetical protein
MQAFGGTQNSLLLYLASRRLKVQVAAGANTCTQINIGADKGGESYILS